MLCTGRGKIPISWAGNTCKHTAMLVRSVQQRRR